MNIRTKLTLRFILITAIIFLLSSTLVYLFSAKYRLEDFYSRLQNKANNTAKLLIEVDEVDIELLKKIERDNPVSLPKEKIIIFNYQDSVIFSTDELREIKIDTTILDHIRLSEEVRFIQNDYEALGFLFKGRFDRFVVIAAAKDIYGLKRLKNLVYILTIVFAISIVIVSISGWVYAGRALHPIAAVVNQVSKISITSLDKRVDEGNGQDEIAKLAQTFNKMLSRLQTSFLTQKNFIANASHELRTPLTSITGQLEVTLLNKRSDEEYIAVINSVLDDIKNLNNLSNRLLLLAQTSSEERDKNMVPVRVDDLLWQIKDEFAKHQPTFTITIGLDQNLDDEKALMTQGDEQLLKTAFSNLIENGCKYSADQRTDIYIKPFDTNLVLEFKDSGIGIFEKDLKNIFEPFHRGSNTKNIKGHGIGLSMVKGIIKMHGGTISVISAPNQGTSVTIVLPGVRGE